MPDMWRSLDSYVFHLCLSYMGPQVVHNVVERMESLSSHGPVMTAARSGGLLDPQQCAHHLLPIISESIHSIYGLANA